MTYFLTYLGPAVTLAMIFVVMVLSVLVGCSMMPDRTHGRRWKAAR